MAAEEGEGAEVGQRSGLGRDMQTLAKLEKKGAR